MEISEPLNGQRAGGIKVGADGTLIMDSVTPEMKALLEDMMNKQAVPPATTHTTKARALLPGSLGRKEDARAKRSANARVR
mmetsp:Transcript_15230/g.34996  ORF Transcript_15230/g.34996 Transcript_15230/m.34996 type:complete len:81 (-) Transcript_15230:368-610(-)